MLLMLAACDPYGPAEPASAEVNVQLKAAGDAEIVLLLPRVREGLSLVQLGDQVAAAVFPRADARRVHIDDQGGAGYPLVRVQVAKAYSPGAHPRLAFELGGAVRPLSDAGLVDIRMTVNAPYVPATARWSVTPDDQDHGYWSWRALRSTQPLPSGEVLLNPRPARAFWSISLLAVTLVCLVGGLFALRARRRWTGVLLGAVALAASLLDVAGAGAVQGDNLGVAGYLSGTALQVVTLLPLVGLFGLPAGTALIVVALMRHSTTTLTLTTSANG
jgi:hypothetical protein